MTTLHIFQANLRILCEQCIKIWEVEWFKVYIVQNKRQVHIYIIYIVTNIDHVQESVFGGQMEGFFMTFKQPTCDSERSLKSDEGA
jgi:hypothetical protein